MPSRGGVVCSYLLHTCSTELETTAADKPFNSLTYKDGADFTLFFALILKQAYKREGHTLFEHFVGFLPDQFKWQMLS